MCSVVLFALLAASPGWLILRLHACLEILVVMLLLRRGRQAVWLSVGHFANVGRDHELVELC